MPKALLCLPPCYCYTYDFPPLGTPMLAGYLKSKNIDVLQADYNMEYLHYWKRKIFNKSIPPVMSTNELAWATSELLNKMFSLKHKKNYYYSPLLSDIDIHYADISNASFSFTERMLCAEYLFRYIEDEGENTFLQFFKEQNVLARLEREGVDVVGISIIAPSQTLAAFTLGYLIKKRLPHIHVTIGGQWVSLYREQLKQRRDWDRFFDSMIVFEGETPLYRLISALRGDGDLSKVPNLIYKSGSRWVDAGNTLREDLDKLAAPDFDGLPLRDYVTAQTTGKAPLTYQTARECYWNKCAYCVDLPLPKQGYRERDMELVIDDIKQLTKKYGPLFLEISNATLSAPQMKKLSERILRENLDVSWWCFARPEGNFTKRIFALAKKAGCRTIAFGLESGNQRVLDFVKKGIVLDTARRVIVDCHDAGIDVNLQMMMGLPSETIQEALDTVKFLIDNKEIIAAPTFNIYYVTPACQVYLNPSQYHIRYKNYPETPFKFFHEFSHITGEVSRDRAYAIINTYQRMISRKKDNGPATASIEAAAAAKEYDLSLTIGKDTVSIKYPSGDIPREELAENYSEAVEHA